MMHTTIFSTHASTRLARLGALLICVFTMAFGPAAYGGSADLTRDGTVDLADMMAMKRVFFSNDAQADLNADGIVDFADLALLQEAAGMQSKQQVQARDPNAFGVSLQPGIIGPEQLGEVITLEVIYNGVGNPILGGGFVISWNGLLLEYVPDSFQYVLTDIIGQTCDLPTSQCIVLDPPAVVPDGGLIQAAAGDFVGIGLLGQPVVVAEMQFVLLAVPDTLAAITLNDGGLGGPFACLFDPACTGLELFPSVVFVEEGPIGELLIDDDRLSFAPFLGETEIQSVTLTNVGEADVAITAIGEFEALEAPFFLNSDGCTGAVLAPSQQCTIQVGFSQHYPDLEQDSIGISTDANFSPYFSVETSGLARERTSRLRIATPDSSNTNTYQFPDVNEGESETVTITLTSAGSADLQLGDIGIEDPLEAPFTGNWQTCANQVLPVGSECTFDVTFSPTFEGDFEDGLDINSDDPGGLLRTLVLTGSGTIALADLTLLSTPPPDTRANVPVDASYVIRNDGEGLLLIGNIAQADPLAAPFIVMLDECSGTTLGEDDACVVDVIFQPVTAGEFADSFDIPSNDPSEPDITVTIEGKATVIGASIPVGVVSFGICKNLTAGTQVTAPAIDGVVDCEAAGLLAASGDTVDVLVPAVALAEQMLALAGGVVTDNIIAVCKNRTTQAQAGYLPGSGVIRCTDTGIEVTAGDGITVLIRGSAL